MRRAAAEAEFVFEPQDEGQPSGTPKPTALRCPTEGHGRAYLIERELEQDGNSALQALVADYLDQAHRLDEIPMATSLLHRYLDALR